MSNNLAENLFIVTAPSGAGKTTLIKNIIEFAKTNNEKVFMSVSHTTRTPRTNESDGTDYFFISEEEFKSNIDEGVYLEHALVHENLYGTPKKAINDHLQRGYKVLLEIDWQGAQQVKEKMPSCIMIFLIPPSREALLSRLKKRGTDSEREIENRFNQAVSDLNESNKFDHVIVNDQIEVTVENIAHCIEGNLNLLNQSEMVDKALKSFYKTN